MGADYSPHQRKLIRNFYRNRDAIETQRLQEIVTEIYLARSTTARARLWQRAAAILARAQGAEAQAVARIVTEQDIEALAALAGARF